MAMFARGVIARLAVWPILCVAMQENRTGPNKRTWIASIIVDAFENQNPLPDDQYVEELLLQAMEDEFDYVVEDGGSEDVARDIIKMWMESQAPDGKCDTIVKFEEMAEKKVSAQIISDENEVDGEGEEDSDDDDWEDEDEGQMEADEVPKL